MAARLWSPRTGKVRTTVSVDRRVVLVAALLALIASAGGLSVSTENEASPSTKTRRLQWSPRAPRQLETCNCEWTTEYACPGKTAGTKGFAQDDGTACFQACCPGASAAERIRALLTQMVLDTEISALLPTLPEEERNARKHANQLINGQQETASVLLNAFTQAPKLTNLTSGLVLYFTKIDPKFLRWSSQEQERWLTKTLVLKRRAHVTNLKDYLDGLASSIQDLLEQGADDGLFPTSDARDKSEGLDDMRLVETAADIEHQIDDATALAQQGAEVAEFSAPLVLAAAGSGLSGGAAITSGLAGWGALIGGGMAAGTVAMAFAPVMGATAGTMLILPDDDAGNVGRIATGAAAPMALGGVMLATTAGGASGPAMMSTLATWGAAGSAVSGGAVSGGVLGGVATLGAVAASSVILVGMGAYGTYKIADYMIVSDEEREAFQCDCEWTLTYACPSSLKPTSPHWAKNDGSMCFDYCCGFVEEVKQIASEIIDHRDLLASEVYKAREQYLIANVPGAVLSANPTVSPLLLAFAVLGSVGIVALGARRLRSVSML